MAPKAAPEPAAPPRPPATEAHKYRGQHEGFYGMRVWPSEVSSKSEQGVRRAGGGAQNATDAVRQPPGERPILPIRDGHP